MNTSTHSDQGPCGKDATAKRPDNVANRQAEKAHEPYARGTRSYTMSRIRGKDTGIERLVRSYLFSKGLRFRKNDKRYPGHPDVVLPRWHTIVFVNGCFWHAHDRCAKHSTPKSNVEFWTKKLLRNKERDAQQQHELQEAGWRVLVVWECELDRKHRDERLDKLYRQIVTTLPAEEHTRASA